MSRAEEMLAELWLENGEPEQELELAELLAEIELEASEELEEIQKTVHEKTMQKIRVNEVRKENPAHARTKRCVWRRTMLLAAGAAAAILILFVSLEPEAAAKVVKGWFAFLPGMSVVETEEEIFFLKETVSVQNEQYRMDITNAKLTGQELLVYLVVTPADPQIDKEAEWEGYSGLINEDKIALEWNGETLDPVNSSGAKGDVYHYEACFELPILSGEADNSDGQPEEYKMTLRYADSIECDFVLAGAEHYEKLSELGAAACHNDIWIAASAQQNGEKLQVDLYALNRSKYKLLSLAQTRGGVTEAEGNSYPIIQHMDSEPYQDFYLKMGDQEIREYEYVARFGGSPSLIFKGKFEQSEPVLVIPSLLAEASEEQKVTIPIPENGEVIELNEKVAFEGGSYLLGNVSRVNREPFMNEWLKIELEAVQIQDDRILTDMDIALDRGLFSQDSGSYVYSRDVDEDGNLTALYWKMREEDTKKLRLILKNPTYRLLTEYELKLEVE